MESITHDLALVMAFLEAGLYLALKGLLALWALMIFGLAIALTKHFRNESKREQGKAQEG